MCRKPAAAPTRRITDATIGKSDTDAILNASVGPAEIITQNIQYRLAKHHEGGDHQPDDGHAHSSNGPIGEYDGGNGHDDHECLCATVDVPRPGPGEKRRDDAHPDEAAPCRHSHCYVITSAHFRFLP